MPDDDTSQREKKYAVLGSTGLKHSGGIIDEEFNRNLQGEKGVKIYKEMSEQNLACVASLGLVNHFLRQADYFPVPASDEPEAREAADLLGSAIDDMEQSWSRFTSEANSDLVFGWSYFDTAYKLRFGEHPDDGRYNSKHNDGKFGWRSIEIRGQETRTKWEIDENGKILGMWQNDDSTDKGEVFLPIDKSVHFIVNQHKNNPEGRSVLRGAYVDYYHLKRVEELQAINIENDATGMPVLTYPVELADSTSSHYNPAKVAELEKKVSSIKRGQYDGLAIPGPKDADGKETGWGIALLRSGGSRQINAEVVIVRHQTNIATAIFYTGFLYLGTGPHGSFALADSKTNTFGIALGAVLDDFCETFTKQASNRLMALNGIPSRFWPMLGHSDIETPNLLELSTFIKDMLQVGGLVMTPELQTRIAEMANLPTDDGGDAVG